MKPIIEVYEEVKPNHRFIVKMNGKEIERMRSFSMQISNEKKNGFSERPFYTAEQYLPYSDTQ